MNPQGDLSCGRPGAGTQGVGIIRIVDGQPYVDEVPLWRMLEQFQGRFAEIAFFFPADVPLVYQTCDEHILPLVQALNEKGVRTFSSCEGHLEERFGYLVSHPFVWVHLADFQKSGLGIPEEWEMSRTDVQSDTLEHDAVIGVIQTKDSAQTQEELDRLQGKAIELAAQIRAIR